jgi:hypothetical protein
VNRLRIVAFPEFSFTHVAKGDIAGLLPVEGTAVGFKAAWDNASSAVVKITAAEGYGISANRALGMFLATPDSSDPECRVKVISPRDSAPTSSAALYLYIQSNNTAAKSAARARANVEEESSIWFRVIVEVFYARSMDVSIFSKKGFGLSANTPSFSGSGADVSRPASTGSSSSSSTGFTSGSVPITGGEADSAAAQTGAGGSVDSLNDRLNKAQNASSPGMSVRFINASDTNISLRRTWQYPVAVGVRAVLLEVNPNTMCVKAIRSSFASRKSVVTGLNVGIPKSVPDTTSTPPSSAK